MHQLSNLTAERVQDRSSLIERYDTLPQPFSHAVEPFITPLQEHNLVRKQVAPSQCRDYFVILASDGRVIRVAVKNGANVIDDVALPVGY